MKAATPLLMGAFACLRAALCSAEDTAATAPPAASEQRDKSSRFRDPKDGQIDLSAFLAKPRAFLPIPLIVTEPAVGYGGGLAGMFGRPARKVLHAPTCR